MFTLNFLIKLIDIFNLLCYYLIREAFNVEEGSMYPVYPVPGHCPVCGENMTVTRLYCPNCDVTVEGRFSLGRLALLTPEQLEFVEVFLRCEGKITRVEKELDISYPTVRSRLNEVITAMGYEVSGGSEPAEELTPAARRRVLDDLAAGRISSEEAVELLRGEMP